MRNCGKGPRRKEALLVVSGAGGGEFWDTDDDRSHGSL